jgi:hypothetical protein
MRCDDTSIFRYAESTLRFDLRLPLRGIYAALRSPSLGPSVFRYAESTLRFDLRRSVPPSSATRNLRCASISVTPSAIPYVGPHTRFHKMHFITQRIEYLEGTKYPMPLGVTCG